MAGDEGFGLDHNKIDAIAKEIKNVMIWEQRLA